MSITVTKHPPELILSQQPVVIEVESNETGTPLRILAGVSGIGGNSIQADANKKAQFELSDYLQGIITDRGNFNNVPYIYDNNPKTIGFVFTELVGDPPISNPELDYSTFYLLDGYIPKPRVKSFYSIYSSLLNFLQITKRDLSWWPLSEPRKITPTDKYMINYLNLSDLNPDIFLHVHVLFSDGTGVDFGQVFDTLQAVEYMKIINFPAGYSELGIQSWASSNYPHKEVVGYVLQIRTGSTNLSANFQFELDRAYYAQSRCFLIRNTFGLLEPLYTHGISTQENELSFETAETSGITTAKKIIWRNEEKNTVKVSSGFLSAEAIQWLSDLLLTTEAYEVTEFGLHPIVFGKITIPEVHDGIYQYFVEIEYEYSFIEVIEQA